MAGLRAPGERRSSAMTVNDLMEISEFSALTDWDILGHNELRQAGIQSRARGVALERILLTEYDVPKHVLLRALSEYYQCPAVQYDERLPLPPEILTGLSAEMLSRSLWMPIMKDVHGTVVIAARCPDSQELREEVRRCIKADNYEFRAALSDDIQWFIQDFLHEKPGYLIGTERTGLAYWRNTMAQWRTRLACYRTDLAKARTGLSFQRWGLGTIAIANTLLHNKNTSGTPSLFFFMLFLGAAIFFYGLPSYMRIRKSRMTGAPHPC
jgi:uncharacterized membrane protein YidH (DUF202 family)